MSEYGSGYSNDDGRGSSNRNDYDNKSGPKRNYSDQNSRGGYNRSNGNDSVMETQRDTIFIQNLPRNVTVANLKEVFSQIGLIKNDKRTGGPKIWIYKDKITGEGKGEATITYEDDDAAQAAINWYNEKEVLKNIVQISLATRRALTSGGRGGFRGRGRGDAGGYRGRGGDRGNDYRGSGRGASHGSSRDHRSNPY